MRWWNGKKILGGLLSSLGWQVSVCAQVSYGQPKKGAFYYWHPHNYGSQVPSSHIRTIFFKLKRFLSFWLLPFFFFSPVIRTFQKVFTTSLWIQLETSQNALKFVAILLKIWGQFFLPVWASCHRYPVLKRSGPDPVPTEVTTRDLRWLSAE